MAAVRPDLSLLVVSVLGRQRAIVDQAISRLSEKWGSVLFLSEVLGFAWTDYYQEGLGSSPVRRLVALDRLGETTQLPEIKKSTCRMEVALARPGEPRTVNIDPGFLRSDQLVLASTKPSAHRIHLGRGIHGELALTFQNKGFAPLPWTYPDYASEELRTLFVQLRALLLELLRVRCTS